MVRRLGMVLMVGGVLAAGSAKAFTMGEVAATTGVQGTLARSGTMKPADTLGTVKRAVGAAAAKKQGQLDAATTGATTQAAWGGKSGGTGGWASGPGGGKSGWASGSGGWTTASSGWASSGTGGASGWATGAWGAR